MDSDTYYIDYSESSGAGDQYDDSSPSENDGRSLTRTGFDPRDSDDWSRVERNDREYPKWVWLNQLNDGIWANDIDARTRRADARRDALTFASQLDMTAYQRERVVFLIDKLDTLSHGNVPAEGTVLAIISLVANEDDWKIREIPTTTVCVDGDCKDVALFTKIMYDCGVSPQSVRRIRDKLRDNL